MLCYAMLSLLVGRLTLRVSPQVDDKAQRVYYNDVDITPQMCCNPKHDSQLHTVRFTRVPGGVLSIQCTDNQDSIA